jgi:hypothetical protein
LLFFAGTPLKPRNVGQCGAVILPAVISETFVRHARNTLKKEHSDMLALIQPTLGVLDAMTARIRELEKSIAATAAEKHSEYEILTRIAGVGLLTSRTFMLTIGATRRVLRASAMWAPSSGWFPSATNPARPTNNSTSARRATPACANASSDARSVSSVPSGRTPR